MKDLKFQDTVLNTPDPLIPEGEAIPIPQEILDLPARVNAEMRLDAPEFPAEDQLAKQVVALIQDKDLTPGEAAEVLGRPAQDVLNPSVRDRIKVLLQDSYVAADTQRAVVRAGRFKMFMETMDAGLKKDDKTGEFDLGALKIAAEMSKQIGSDPEIGLNQPPQQVVNIDIRGLAGVLETLDPLPGFKKEKDA